MNDEEILREEIDNNTLFIKWDFGDNIVLPDNFQDWFFTESRFLGKAIDLPIDLKIVQFTNGQCFHNGQLISTMNSGIKYYEGIIYGPQFKSCIHHGFNYHSNGVIDVTYLKNKKDFDEAFRDKYLVYFGVEISNDFIEKYNEKILKPNQHNPILLEYYNYTHNKGN